MKQKKVALIGYSGHAYVVADIILKTNQQLLGYFEQIKKSFNPFDLPYLGDEQNLDAVQVLWENDYFVAIGNNELRNKITHHILGIGFMPPLTIIHPKATIGERVVLREGTMIGAGTIINPLAQIGRGVICNTASVIEHECQIGNFVHIAPGAVLNGNVSIGEQSFVGANAVIKQGVKVGKRVVIGAGTVVLKDIGDDQKIVGNPGRLIT